MKPQNYGKLFTFMGYENSLAIRVTLETGMRIGDVLKLRPSDLRGRTLTFVAEKTGKKGRVTISADLAKRLKLIAGKEYIFTKRGGGGHRSRQAVWKDVKQAAARLKAAGLLHEENITPHSARKTFAVADSEKNGLLHTQKQLQHRSKETTKLYIFSEKLLGDMTDNYVLKELIRQVALITEKLDYLAKIVQNEAKTVDREENSV